MTSYVVLGGLTFLSFKIILSSTFPKAKLINWVKGVLCASTGTPTWPCAMLLRYAALAKRNLDSVEFVFQSFSFSSSKGYSLRSGTSLSYTRAREVVWLSFGPSVLIRRV